MITVHQTIQKLLEESVIAFQDPAKRTFLEPAKKKG
jgi:hypothetical protein